LTPNETTFLVWALLACLSIIGSFIAWALIRIANDLGEIKRAIMRVETRHEGLEKRVELLEKNSI
jgi:hypothetical protein